MNKNGKLGQFLRALSMRFDLVTDSAPQAEVVENIRKGVEYRGTNLWVLIFAIMIASLGLNVNSTAVIIGAMLISPLMGPIVGMGLAIGINDFELLKNALRNFLLMITVSIVTSTLYFWISPISIASSELLARTTPSTYDVLIALFGGLAGIVAQTRKERTYVVVAGVAIATALMPPLCTAGYGLATGQMNYFFGAFYLFIINTLFIAIATYLMVVFLRYDKKVFINKDREKKVQKYMLAIAIIAIVPSVVLGYRIVNRTTFEDNVDRYVNSVFKFDQTMIVDYEKSYRQHGKTSTIEIRLVGEQLSNNVVDNIRAQMGDYGLRNTELVIKQAAMGQTLNFSDLQKSYADILDDRNSRIEELQERIASLNIADTIAVADISREMGAAIDNIGSVSVAKHINFGTDGSATDTTVVCFVAPLNATDKIDTARIANWLKVRMKNDNLKLIIE